MKIVEVTEWYITQDITIVYEGKNVLSFDAEICD